MASQKTARFQISTVLPELVNQRIERIETRLQEIFLDREQEDCIARGLVERRICFRKSGAGGGTTAAYLQEKDGLRSRLDRFQFSVLVGDGVALSEKNATPRVELRQEFFTFQPGGEQQPAVLLQGFILEFPENVTAPSANTANETVEIDRVAAQGKGVTMLRTVFTLPPGSIPKTFNGDVAAAGHTGPPYNLKLTGNIIYRSQNGQLTETELTKESLLTDFVPPQVTQGPVRFYFTIANYHFRPGRLKEEWCLDVKTDYQWYQLKKEMIHCPLPAAGQGGTVLTALLSVPVATYQRHFMRTFFLTMPDLTPGEIQCTILRHQEQIVSNGLLLNLELQIEVCGIDGNHYEIVKTADVQTEELWGEIPEIEPATGIRAHCEVRAQTGMFTTTTAGIRVPVFFECQLVIIRDETRDLTSSDGGGELYYIKQLCGEKVFNWTGEECLRTNGATCATGKAIGSLTGQRILLRRDWLDYQGEIEIMLDDVPPPLLNSRIYRIPVRESFFWEGLPAEASLEYQASLKTDALYDSGGVLLYHYFINLSCKAWVEKPVMLRTKGPVLPSPLIRLTDFQTDAINEPESKIRIQLEKILPFQSGFPSEFVENKLDIAGFESRRLNQRLFISGILEWHSAYWDSKGFLRRENRDIPFWQFHDEAVVSLKKHWHPRIHSFKIEPLFTPGWLQRDSGGKRGIKKKGKLFVAIELRMEEV